MGLQMRGLSGDSLGAHVAFKKTPSSRSCTLNKSADGADGVVESGAGGSVASTNVNPFYVFPVNMHC